MKLDRLIGILSVLLRQEKAAAPELAEKFEDSRRAVRKICSSWRYHDFALSADGSAWRSRCRKSSGE